ncbi:hypothetical protein DM02DRAFT_249288 [Periconia macrospinosa]|uniref:Uncharacterized protein n=1 Tax=Periconia macrospinosa TaxID=97972 RepID=A0A2V1D4Z3_9PLEO|nr:hypothetical protein DM02DRAFT_249288 [Periconia macrospinosa]
MFAWGKAQPNTQTRHTTHHTPPHLTWPALAFALARALDSPSSPLQPCFRISLARSLLHPLPHSTLHAFPLPRPRPKEHPAPAPRPCACCVSSLFICIVDPPVHPSIHPSRVYFTLLPGYLDFVATTLASSAHCGLAPFCQRLSPTHHPRMQKARNLLQMTLLF